MDDYGGIPAIPAYDEASEYVTSEASELEPPP
jgi:hypothetical protein